MADELYTPKTQVEIEQSILTKLSELKPDLTLKSAGIAGLLISALSYFLEGQDRLFSDLSKEGNIATATGTYLDNIGADHNFTRKEAQVAVAAIVFARLQPALSDIIIPAGTKVQTTPDPSGNVYVYETLVEVTLAQDTYQIAAEVEAVAGGSDYNKTGEVASVLDHGASNAELIFTSNVGGALGNLITVRIVSAGSLSISVSNFDITINVNLGVTTAAQVVTALQANIGANSLVSVEFGGDGSGFPAVLSITNLAGGINGEIDQLSTFLSNISIVTNVSDASGGVDEESDEDFRQRIKQGIVENFGKVTAAGYENVARSIDNVKTAVVYTNAADIATLAKGTANAGLIFVAKSYGAYGNNIRVQCTSTGSLSVSASGLDITITVNSGVTTAAQVKTALEANNTIMALINVEFAQGGVGSSAFATFAFANLAGGLGANGVAPNEFTVYITDDSDDGFPENSLVDEVQEALNSSTNRSPNDIITVAAPTAVDITVTAVITEYLTGADEATVILAVETALKEYIASLASGDDVYLNSIRNIIHDTAGVVDFTISAPAANTAIANNEKARLLDANLNIT